MRTRSNISQEEIYEKALLTIKKKLEEYHTGNSSHALRANLVGYINGILNVIEVNEEEK